IYQSLYFFFTKNFVQNISNLSAIKWIKSRFKIFCKMTSAHDFRFLIDKTCNKWEKTFWSTNLVICSCIASMLIWYSMYLSSDTPTVNIVESVQYPTYKIPFPAVTICNVNKISKKAIYAMAKELKNPIPNTTVNDTLDTLNLLRGYIDFKTDFGENFEDLDTLLAHNNMKIHQVMEKLMPLCSDMIQKCYWRGTEVRCDAFFQDTLTFFGACCSFNYLGLKSASQHDNSTRTKSSILNQVKLVTTSGPSAGLIVVLNPLYDDYFYTSYRMTGFRVIIHDSYDFPGTNSPNILIQDNYATYLGVMPDYTYSKEEVLTKEISLRKCYDDSEVDLNVMRRYSYKNCMNECRRLITYKLCGCVPYNYPRNGTLPICNAVENQCIMKNYHLINEAEPQLNISLDFIHHTYHETTCRCLPACKYFTYSVTPTQSKVRFNQSVRMTEYL
ncbi:sodium channel protein Nach-like, partial [Culicoides brevitarsis]|uniref:sodium channel protein Nach-like n=1 Tax=Culicoides brevitarsis TaxID=469753 RepID=UPI00307CC7DC